MVAIGRKVRLGLRDDRPESSTRHNHFIIQRHRRRKDAFITFPSTCPTTPRTWREKEKKPSRSGTAPYFHLKVTCRQINLQNQRGVVVPLDELLLPGVVDPGELEVPCDEVPEVPCEPLCDPPCELLPEVEEPAAPDAPDAPLRLLGYVELPGLIPRCEPAAPGDPIPLAPAPLCCCIATVRLSDSTICSSRAIRASSEPAPEIELPELNVPLPPAALPLAPDDVPNVPDPPTDEDCPSPLLERVEVLPDCPREPD